MTPQWLLVLAVTVIVFFGFVRERRPADVTALLGIGLPMNLLAPLISILLIPRF
jgi:hypothetical protein